MAPATQARWPSRRASAKTYVAGAILAAPGFALASIDWAARRDQIAAWPAATVGAYVGTIALSARSGRALVVAASSRRALALRRRCSRHRGLHRRDAALHLRALPRVPEPARGARRDLDAPERRATALGRPRELPALALAAGHARARLAGGARALRLVLALRARGRARSRGASPSSRRLLRRRPGTRRASGIARRPLPGLDGAASPARAGSTTTWSSGRTRDRARPCPFPRSSSPDTAPRACSSSSPRACAPPTPAACPIPAARRRRSRTSCCRSDSASRRCARSTRRPRCRSRSSGAASRRRRRAATLHAAPLLWEYAHAAGYRHRILDVAESLLRERGHLARGGAARAPGERDRSRSEPDLRDRRGRREARSTCVLRDLPAMARGPAPFVGVVHLSNTHFPYVIDEADAPFQPESHAFGAGDASADPQPLPRRDPPAGRARRAARPGASRDARRRSRRRHLHQRPRRADPRARGHRAHMGRLRRRAARPLLDRCAARGAHRLPRRRASARLANTPLTQLDVLPTLLDLLGLWEAPEHRSLPRERCRARACFAAARPLARSS